MGPASEATPLADWERELLQDFNLGDTIKATSKSTNSPITAEFVITDKNNIYYFAGAGRDVLFKRDLYTFELVKRKPKPAFKFESGDTLHVAGTFPAVFMDNDWKQMNAYGEMRTIGKRELQYKLDHLVKRPDRVMIVRRAQAITDQVLETLQP